MKKNDNHHMGKIIKRALEDRLKETGQDLDIEKSDLQPNADKKLDIKIGTQTYRRYPLQTRAVRADDNLQKFILDRLRQFSKVVPASEWSRPWRLYVSEKIVAITQGRSYFIWDINPGFWARTLSRFVVKTPYGIGLGSPWTMQLAIQEAGLPRIVFAALAGAVGKAIGKRGVFYNLAGSDVRAIDGPTEYSVYPSNVSAKLPPKNPSRVAKQLSQTIRKELPTKVTSQFMGVVVIDANDLGRNVLGHDTDHAIDHLEAVFADNPLGQGSERTPLAVVFEE